MQSEVCVKVGFSGIMVGGSGGLSSLKLMGLSIFMIALSIVTLSDFEMSRRNYRVNLDKQIPFKCTACNTIVLYAIRDLQKLQRPNEMGPMMGPMTLECPICRTKNLTQAVECPRCRAIFVMKMDPSQNLFDDRCPRCLESYAKSWQEKYRKTQGE